MTRPVPSFSAVVVRFDLAQKHIEVRAEGGYVYYIPMERAHGHGGAGLHPGDRVTISLGRDGHARILRAP